MLKLFGSRKRLVLPTALLLAVSALGTHGAGQTDISTRYSPLHPANRASITFTINATDPAGISRIRLYLYEYEWESNHTTVRRRPSGTWGQVKDWSVSGSPTSIGKQHQVAGFPAGTFVVYAVKVKNGSNQETIERWGFAAGDWTLGDDVPIPLWIAPPLSGTNPGNVLASVATAKTNRINIVFIAQENDGYNEPHDLLTDLDGLIFDSFLASEPIKLGKQFWAFYYSNQFGTISPYVENGSSTMTLTPALINTTNLSANAGVIVHRQEFRDWSSGHFLGTQPGAQNFGTTLHELGHSVFDLADEYAASNFASTKPFHNNYDSLTACFNYNFDNGWRSSDSEAIDGTYWRPEPESLNCVMRRGNTLPGVTPHYARSCMKRVEWFYDQLR